MIFAGHRLGTASRTGKKASSVFDPATLTLTGWWRASYAGAPWSGEASVGSSGGRTIVAGDAPTAGTTQNGLAPADFDGATQHLVSAADFDTFIAYAAGTIVVLFRADTAAADAGAGSRVANPGLVTQESGGAGFGLCYSSSGVTAALYEGSYTERAVAAGTGAYHMAFCRWDSTNLELGVDAGAMSSTACGPIDPASTGALNIGTEYAVTAFFDGRILEIMTAQSALNDAARANIRSYFNSRYALAL